MFFSGLKLCHNCGVYEIYGSRRKRKGTLIKHCNVYYWSNIPKYGLQKELCPKCNPNSEFDVIVDHSG